MKDSGAVSNFFFTFQLIVIQEVNFPFDIYDVPIEKNYLIDLVQTIFFWNVSDYFKRGREGHILPLGFFYF